MLFLSQLWFLPCYFCCVLFQHTWMFQTPAQFMPFSLGHFCCERAAQVVLPSINGTASAGQLLLVPTTANAREKAPAWAPLVPPHAMERMKGCSDTRGSCSWKLQACRGQRNGNNTTRQVCPGKHSLGFTFQQRLGTVHWRKVAEIPDVKAGWFWARGGWASTGEALKRRTAWWIGALFES